MGVDGNVLIMGNRQSGTWWKHFKGEGGRKEEQPGRLRLREREEAGEA